MVNAAEQKQLYLKYSREVSEEALIISGKVSELTAPQLVKYYYSRMDNILTNYNTALEMSSTMWNTSKIYEEYNKQYNLPSGIEEAYKLDNAENKVRSIIDGEGKRVIKRAPLESAKVYETEIQQPLRKEWRHGGSDDVRNNHVDADGQVRRIGDKFNVSGKEVQAPGGFGKPEEDIYCSCYITVIK